MSKGKRINHNWTKVKCPDCNGEGIQYTKYGPKPEDVYDYRDCDTCLGMRWVNVSKPIKVMTIV